MFSYLLYLGGMLGVSLFSFTLSAVCWLQIRNFVQNHSAISESHDLDELKRIVKVNMYASLGMIATAAVLVVGSGIAIWLGVIGGQTLLTGVFGFGGLCCVGGAILTSAERRLRDVPLENPSLRDEYDHVLKRWTSSALPDW